MRRFGQTVDVAVRVDWVVSFGRYGWVGDCGRRASCDTTTAAAAATSIGCGRY